MAKEQMTNENGATNLDNALETLDSGNNSNENVAAPQGNAAPEGTTQPEGEKQPESTAELRSKDEEAKDNKKLLNPQISDGALLGALRKAFGFGRKALHLEIATSLAKFAEDGSMIPNKATRSQIIRLYAQAGYDVQSSKGDDYKTVWRRMDAAAELYQTITRPKIYEAMQGKTDAEALAALTEYLAKTYNFTGINSVFAAAQKPVKQTNTPEYRASKAAEADATKSQPPMQPDTAQQPEASAEGVSTKAGGEPGTAEPQGHVAAGGVNEQGQPLTKDGTIDKRVKTDDQPSLATQEARGEISKEDADKQAGKQPEQPAADGSAQKASPEDRATAAGLAEQMQDRRKNRRSSDSPDAIIFTTDHTHVALPHGITKQEVMYLAQQLLAFAAEMDEDEESAKQKHSLAALQAARAGGNNRRQATHAHH
jgi:hypothetical protein